LQALERIGVTVHLAALTNGMLKGAEAKVRRRGVDLAARS
jgi:hypothetical protein